MNIFASLLVIQSTGAKKRKEKKFKITKSCFRVQLCCTFLVQVLGSVQVHCRGGRLTRERLLSSLSCTVTMLWAILTGTDMPTDRIHSRSWRRFEFDWLEENPSWLCDWALSCMLAVGTPRNTWGSPLEGSATSIVHCDILNYQSRKCQFATWSTKHCQNKQTTRGLLCP